MAPPGLRPPSRIDQFSFPLFAVDWFAEVKEEALGDDGQPPEVWSWVAYCGGGGAAKTGVRNNIIVIRNDDLPFQISTGDQAGVSLKIFQSPATKRMYMLVALGNTVRRYCLSSPTCELMGQVDVGENCEHLAVSPAADQFAIGVGETGKEDGRFKVYKMTEEGFATPETLLYTCHQHSKALTSMAYSPKGDRIISASRDGTAIIWKNGKVVTGMRCTIPEPKKGRPQQVLVRGCAFADKEGKYVVTVHSGRKSEGYVSLWKQTPENKYKIVEKSLCTPLPATALSISMDKNLLAIGVADGSVILWDKVDWRPFKTFQGVHELPVTCIAARPLQHPFVGEKIRMQCRTGSLDCNSGVLSVSTQAPPKKPSINDGRSGFCGWFVFLVYWVLTLGMLFMALQSMFPHAQDICAQVHERQGLRAASLCLWEEVFYINPSKLGSTFPPM